MWQGDEARNVRSVCWTSGHMSIVEGGERRQETEAQALKESEPLSGSKPEPRMRLGDVWYGARRGRGVRMLSKGC